MVSPPEVLVNLPPIWGLLIEVKRTVCFVLCKYGFCSNFQRSCYHTMPVKRLSSLYSSLLFTIIDAYCMMMQKMSLGEYTLKFFLNWKNFLKHCHWNHFIRTHYWWYFGSRCSGKFSNFEKFTIGSLSKPSGPTDYFDIPT